MTEANAVAWELAELVGPHLGRAERAELYVSIDPPALPRIWVNTRDIS